MWLNTLTAEWTNGQVMVAFVLCLLRLVESRGSSE